MAVNQASRAIPRLDLGAAVMEYMDGENAFIGTQVLPIFKSMEQSANYSGITRASITRTSDLKRAANGKYNRDDYQASDYTFRCEEYGQEQAMDDGQRRVYASDFAADLVASKIATRRVLAGQEIRINNLLFNTSVFTGATLFTDISGSAPFDTAASDVLAAVIAAKEKVRGNCGMPANALVMGRTNLERLMLNTALIGAISPSTIPTHEQKIAALAGWFGVRKIYVGDAVRNTANEGIAFSGADIWNEDYVMVARLVENADDLSEPGLGRTFLWVADCPENTTVEEYRDEPIRSDIFRVRQHTDELVLDPAFGHLLKVD